MVMLHDGISDFRSTLDLRLDTHDLRFAILEIIPLGKIGVAKIVMILII
jgi:hypothetical protein